MNKTAIPYLDRAWNPVTGCSCGCPECWARAMAHRFGKSFEPTFHPEKLGQPAKRKKPATVGVCFTGDLFDPGIGRFFAVYSATRAIDVMGRHKYIFITKRAEDMAHETVLWHCCDANMYFLVTVRTQRELDAATPHIFKMSLDHVSVGLSIEPMQGPVDISEVAEDLCGVILGGQSGPKAVPLHADWVRTVRDQCAEAETPFMFKQWSQGQERGEHGDGYANYHYGLHWPLLDGKIHSALAWPLHEKELP